MGFLRRFLRLVDVRRGGQVFGTKPVLDYLARFRHRLVRNARGIRPHVGNETGLTFRSDLPRDEGLLLVGKRDSRLDSSIHMFFVPFDLSVVWINSAMQVVDKVLARSWRPAYFSKKPARYVLELHPERWGDFEIGDTVEFKDA